MRQLFLVYLFLAFSSVKAVDYAQLPNWAALPDRADNADWIPVQSGWSDKQDSASVDVFYIHPTTALSGYSGNASLNDKALNRRTDEFPIKYQASVFNGSCKVYAPRYRQAVLHNFFTRHTEKSQQAFDLAYQDIKAAFQYYLEHFNHGRPIIIAGHSQGSMHAQRLLREFFDGTSLQQKLVEAYIIGYPTQENQFQFLQVSNHPDTFGGYISYCTFGMDAPISFLTEYTNAVVVNPLSWTTEKTFVAAEYHLGAISKQWQGIKKNLCGARCGNGVLEIQKPSASGFIPMAYKNYHLFDYALFYANIRENVALRVKTFMETRKSTQQ